MTDHLKPDFAADRVFARSVDAPSVDIVIVNWNSGPYLRECVAALDRSVGAERFNVVVVDNASTDHSAHELATARAQFHFNQNPQNLGFAKASNQGARTGCAPYVLFLNPDVRVEPAAIDRAVAFLDAPAHADIGILGVQLVDRDGRIQRCCARTPSVSTLLLHRLFLDRVCPGVVPSHFLSEWDHGDTRDVDQVIGAFLLIRRALFNRLGGFDERFFLYYEDVDLCLSARQAGSRVVYFTGARAEHAGGGSSNAVKARRLYWLAVSRVEYAVKRHGRFAAVALTILTLCLEMPIRWLHANIAGSPTEGRSVLRALAWACKDLGKLTFRMGVRA